MARELAGTPELLTPGEVGRLFRVNPRTVWRWANQGRIRSVRTPGGHRRYRAADVRALLKEQTEGLR
jgi:excisionase family DNA binding protein